METNRHAIKAHRGETFTIDKVFRNKDGSPYIISNAIKNPYLLLSVADSEYAETNRFFRNYWLDLKDFPRFTLTQPLSSEYIQGWSEDSVIPTQQKLDQLLFDTLLTCTIPNEYASYDSEDRTMMGIWTWRDNIVLIDFKLADSVKYSIDFESNGVRYTSISIETANIEGLNTALTQMKYDDTVVMNLQTGDLSNLEWINDAYKVMNIGQSSDLIVEIDGELFAIGPEFAVIEHNGKYLYWNDGWVPYECRFIKTFLSDDTKDWNAQRYLYSIQLAYGVSNREYLESLADEYGIVYSKTVPVDNDWLAPPYMTNKELYESLLKLGYVFGKEYDPEIPIQNVSAITLLPQSELVMLNYPQGGVF